MGNADRGLVFGDLGELLVDLEFRHRVQGGGGFVQHQEGNVLVERPCYGDLLGFAAGDLHALLVKFLIQIGVEAMGKSGKPFSEFCLFQSRFDRRFVIAHIGRHALAQLKGEQVEILEHHGEQPQIFLIIVFPDIHAV